MIHVVAILTAKPGQREQVLAAFRDNMPAVLAEKGCVEYTPVVDVPDNPRTPVGSDTFIVLEKWATIEDFHAHGASAHMAAYGAKVKDLMAGRLVHVLNPVF